MPDDIRPSVLDPITAEVVRNALIAYAEEMTINLARTAHATIVYEVQDFATGILDPRARLIAQAPGGLPLFVGDLDAAVLDGLALFGPDGFAPGDVILTNHTGTCGQHLNNVVVYTPAFHEGRLIGFPVTRAHWPDVGGKLAGGFLTDAVSSFEEGIQLRSLKIWKAGKPDEELMRLIRHNVRLPEISFGDLRAQIAACRLAERRLSELYRKYGAAKVEAGIAASWDHSERLVRAAISGYRDGVYEAESFLDDDGVDIGKPVPIRARVTVAGDRLTVDFSGMSPQVRGPINSGRAAGLSAARLALKYLCAPDLPPNDGCFRPLDVVLPTGTLISAEEPAAMSWWQTPILTVIDTILKAMAQAAPERIPAAHYSDISCMLLTGRDPATGRAFTNIEPVAGGWGARPHGDGPSATYTIGHGDTFNIPIEVLETRFPLHVERYALRRDSGGPGRHRGGLGLERIYRVTGDALFNGLSERSVCPPWGLGGGTAGRSGEIFVRQGAKQPRQYHKVTGLKLAPGDVVTFRTGGGGGHGDALDRAPERVLDDVLHGRVSARQARDAYGVVLGKGGRTVDVAATAKLRAELRQDRLGRAAE